MKFNEKLFAGEVHYSRIPVQYWDHRIKTIKALGMNALSIYIMWNYHEIQPGIFDWTTQNKNLDKFLSLAADNKMLVLIRPGPYVCAEWDLGGLPVWLLKDGSAKMRQNDPTFLAHVKTYFSQLAPIFNKYDYKKTGGPIKLLQIENQYGSYGSDLDYINALRNIWKDLDVTIQQYHADTLVNLQKSHWPGGHIGLNAATTQKDYITAKAVDPDAYVFGGEIYTGWLTHWGEPWAMKPPQLTLNLFQFHVKNNYSFSMFVVHGGTNFGLTSGANLGAEPSDYKAEITSYDYDAPINQQGSYGQKYISLRNLLKQYADWQIPEPPEPIKMISIPSFTPKTYASLLSNLGQGIQTNKFTYFQSDELKMYSQGIVVYQCEISEGDYIFEASFRDFAIIYLDNVPLKSYDRAVSSSFTVQITCCKPKSKLSILVQAMGHINYNEPLNHDIKGLVKFNIIKGSNPTHLRMHKIPLNYQNIFKMNKIQKQQQYPQLGIHNFDLQEIGDTYLNMQKFQKGYVWINGRNLGRYWNKGPQFKLFCPGVWLKLKNNELIVLQMLGGMSQIKGEYELKTESQLLYYAQNAKKMIQQDKFKRISQDNK